VTVLEPRGIRARFERKISGCAFDGRAASGKDYAISLRRRKMIEARFG
jgi:hypothetical protein